MSFKFKPKEKVTASTGLRIQLAEKIDILPGMPLVLFKNNLDEVKKMFKKEISENIKTDKQGIIVKADSLGSLEALLVLLKQANIPVLKAGIGDINKNDIISAKANSKINEVDAVIGGFNVPIDSDTEEMRGNVKIITDEVVYKLIDEIQTFREEKRKEIEKNRLMGLATICKLKILSQYVFRNTKPAIFGVSVEGGKIFSGLKVIDETNEEVGRVKNIQSENKSVSEATEGMEVAISMPGVNFQHALGDRKFLYSEISENQFRNFKKNKDLLSSSELKILQEIAEIKRRKKEEWGK